MRLDPATRNVRDYSHQVAEVNRLSFLTAQEQLASITAKGGMDSPPIARSRLPCCQLSASAHRYEGGQSLEEHMLRVDYQVMRVCYFLAKPFSRSSARQALLERASIISHLANAMGERVAL